jgi:hypothetical protein
MPKYLDIDWASLGKRALVKATETGAAMVKSKVETGNALKGEGIVKIMNDGLDCADTMLEMGKFLLTLARNKVNAP